MIRKITLLGLILMMICGCAAKTPVIATYLLSPPTVQVPSGPSRTHEVLLISAMTADSGYKTKAMIYVTAPAYLRPYSKNSWVEPPAQMLPPIIAHHVAAKKYFKAVVMPPFFGTSDYRLDTRLITLQQEFISNPSQVRCVIQAVLINSRTGKVVADHQFQALISAPGNNPQSGVSAANQAANQVSEEIAEFVVEHLKR